MGFPMGPGTLHQHNQPEEDLHLRSETSNYILVATSDHDSLVSGAVISVLCKICISKGLQIGVFTNRQAAAKIARLKTEKTLLSKLRSELFCM